jgi:hypothetical protein
MGLEGFGLFNKLLKKGYNLADMGLRGRPGDVTRLAYRLRVAKSFRGLNLEGVTARTTKGYDAFMLVFLTHSALEQYLDMTDQALDDIEPAHRARGAEKLLAEFFEADRGGKLVEFLHKKLDNKRLREKLIECRERRCCNVGVISAAIRHIFVHGYLAANSNKINPAHVFRVAKKLSDFLLDYMDHDFRSRMREYARGKKV